ncbi:IPT/TIG domain-containing protein [Leucobacter weissii]|uniref:IPT/TIG domain-containing protein n=1 Tax=Leucobacter weissii TaxID=1983706 RepID=A0A939SAM7_9MICO|nr:IPT/TIG domain-containing protein [Leucobacter weissii]MBO1900568.1 IPT/TIG domain-containing protein [Leucobacter weissii]
MTFETPARSAAEQAAHTQLPPARRAGRRSLAAALVGALSLGSLVAFSPVTADSSQASTGGTATTKPVTARLDPILLDGTTSGQLNGRIDLPVPLGDIGEYELPGITAPQPDASGNATVEKSYPAGPIDGVLTDPEDGEVDEEPGRGIDIGDSTDRIVRTPSGLEARTELRDVVVDVNGLNDKAGTVLEVGEIVRADRVDTVAVAGVGGGTSVKTEVAGLTLLGQGVALVEGRLPSPVTRTHTVNLTKNDFVRIAAALGIDPEDVSEYEGLISSATLNLTLAVTVSTPAAGGLLVTANISGTAKASAILGLGSADLRTGANDRILDATFAAAEVSAPSALQPVAESLDPDTAEPGEAVTVHGTGFVVGGTRVTVAGTDTEVLRVDPEGRSVEFRLPEGLSGGRYPVLVETVGGSVDAGELTVDADDTVPLSITGITPGSGIGGSQVTITGSGLVPGATSVRLTDADGTVHRIGASRVSVAESRVSATFLLPDAAATGQASVVVSVPGQTADPVNVTVTPYELSDVPASGDAWAKGLQGNQQKVSLTVDNSSAMTWTAPTVINPAGEAGPYSVLNVSQGGVDTTGHGSNSGTEGGYTGTVTRTLDALKSEVRSDDFKLDLPAPWNSFFSPAGSVVRANSVSASSTARTDGGLSNQVALDNLTVLGNQVPLVDGKLTQAHTYEVRYDSNDLKNRQAMNGVFWSAAGGGYDRLKSETYGTLWVTVRPAAETASGGVASTAAFEVTAEIQYRYNGENGGFLSTRARHGSGNSRDGQRVTFLDAKVGEVRATTPAAVAPAITSATPSDIEAGTQVSLQGRGFSADSVVRLGGQSIAPDSISSNGTQLAFTVPDLGTGYYAATVRNTGGDSNARTLAFRGAPVFTLQPEATVTGRAGQNVTLNVAADGVPDADIQWQRLGEQGWEDIPDETAAGYRFGLEEEDHGARLRAVASNSEGSASSTETEIFVQIPPSIVEQPGDASVTAGESAVFTVQAAGRPTPDIQWQRRTSEGWEDIAGETGAQLSFAATSADHGSEFRARVSNAASAVSSQPAGLSVRFQPEITRQPGAVLVADGSAVQIVSEAAGNPAPSVAWQVRAPGSSEWTAIDPAEHASASTGRLELTAGAAWHGATVRAEYRNEVGSAVFTDEVPIAVLPELSVRGTADVGDELSIAGLGDPETDLWGADAGISLEYQWLRDGEEIAGADAIGYTLSADDHRSEISVRVTAARSGVDPLVVVVGPTGPVMDHFTSTEPPAISGTATVGHDLTVDPGAWSIDDVELSYAWFADGVRIDGADSAELTLRPAQYAARITARVAAEREGYYSVAVLSDATEAVSAGAFEHTAEPEITGTVRVGETLSASAGEWSVDGTAASYQWLRNGAEIDGATGRDYLLTPLDFEQRIGVRVTATVHGYADAQAESSDTAAVEAGHIAGVDAPSISGTARVGESLHATTGTWSVPGTAYQYQWLAGGEEIEGATAAAYALTAADLGKTITVRVTAIATGYRPEPAESAATEEIGKGSFANTALPQLSGAAIVGETLTVSAGEWQVPGTDHSVQWLRNGVPIAGATGSSYLLTDRDHTAAITATVTATKAGYLSARATSAASDPVANGSFANTVLPAVSGSGRVGEPLSVDAGEWGGISPTLAFQWYRGDDAIAGAVDSVYEPTAEDRGQTLTVRVVATAKGYADTVVTASVPAQVTEGVIENETAPAVAGELEVGGTLTAEPGSWSRHGVSVSYLWSVEGSSATHRGREYVLRPADEGRRVTLTVTASKIGYADATETVTIAGVVSPGTLSLAADPVLSGDPVVGSEVTVAPGRWDRAGVATAYQWLRDGRPVDGATEATYTIRPDDVGRDLAVTLTGSAAGYRSISVTVELGEAPRAAELAVSTRPSIGGRAVVGGTVTANPGSWAANGVAVSGVEVSYQWLLGGSAIAGATSASYQVPASARGKQLSLRVTASKDGHVAAGVNVAPRTVAAGTFAARSVSLKGTARAGKTLKASASWTVGGVKNRYRWVVGGKTVSNGTKSGYKVKAKDRGKRITVTVTGTKSGYATATAKTKTVKVSKKK